MKIEISDIPGFFPSDYPEQLYIDESKYRIKQDTPDIVIYRTNNKIRVKSTIKK